MKSKSKAFRQMLGTEKPLSLLLAVITTSSHSLWTRHQAKHFITLIEFSQNPMTFVSILEMNKFGSATCSRSHSLQLSRAWVCPLTMMFPLSSSFH